MPTPAEIDKIRKLRWRARTDLQFLCNAVLSYPDVNKEVHGPVLKHLQNFPAPVDDAQAEAHDKWEGSGFLYRPLKNVWDVDDNPTRKMLLLDPRGSLKSTINCVAHTIQWIINYPSITILLMQANLDKATTVLGEIKEHFQRNQAFRALFPEHCPEEKKAGDWGTQTEFTTEARRPESAGGIESWNQKEGTVIAKSLGAGLAGLHFCVMKFSDIVEQGNSENDEQCRKVIKYFSMCRNLLIRPNGWIDVEGTRYHRQDLYGNILAGEIKLKEEGLPPNWRIFARGCYLPNMAGLNYTERKYNFEELELPDLLDDRGKPISFWPERFSSDFLEAERKDPISEDAQFLFNCQRKNLPLNTNDRVPFPKEKFTTISRNKYLENVPISYRQVTVDTADTQNKRSNYTCITTGAWSQSGKLYIEDIIHGKFQPDEIVFWLFWTAMRENSPSRRPVMYFIEETAFVRGMMASVNRVHDTGILHVPDNLEKKYGKSRPTNGIRLPITLVKRETTLSKQERILQTLQPWYNSGELIFLDDIPCMSHILQEFLDFPQAKTDDIIDTVADQFQQKEYFGRLAPRKPTLEEYLRTHRDPTEEIMIYGEQIGQHNIPTPYVTDRWGGL